MPCATPSPGRATAAACSRRWSGTTSSWSRWTIGATGTATTTSSPTCCAAGCWTSSPASSRSCTDGRDLARAGGRRRRGDPALPARARTSRVPRELIETVMPGAAAGTAARRPCADGWRPCRAEVLRARPVLGNALAGARMSTGAFEGVEELLDATEEWLRLRWHAAAASSRGSWTDEEYRRLPADLAVHRAGLALVRGDIEQTVAHARAALELVGDDDHVTRGAAFALRWPGGVVDRRPGHRPRVVRRVPGRVRARSTTSRTCWAAPSRSATSRSSRAGSRKAARTYRSALDLADRHHAPVLRAAPTCTWGWLPVTSRRTTSPRPVASSRAAGSSASTPDCRRTPTGGAWSWPGSARRRVTSRPPSTCWTRPSGSTWRTSPRASDRSPPSAPGRGHDTGHVDAALDWADQARPVAGRPVTYLREFEHLTLAQVLSARARTRAGQRGDLGARGRPSWTGCCAAADGGGPRRIGHRDPGDPRARAPAAGRPGRRRWRRSAQPWSSPSRRATCAPSSTRARPWPPCWRPRSGRRPRRT